MSRVILLILILAVSVSGGCGNKYFAMVAWAQEPTPPAPTEPAPTPPPTPVPAPPPEPPWFNWQPLLAGFINTVVVLGLVQVVKRNLPVIRVAIPWLLPTITMLIGPIVSVVQTALADWLGMPIDLSPVLAIFTGATAVTLHQINRQSHPPNVATAMKAPSTRAG